VNASIRASSRNADWSPQLWRRTRRGSSEKGNCVAIRFKLRFRDYLYIYLFRLRFRFAFEWYRCAIVARRFRLRVSNKIADGSRFIKNCYRWSAKQSSFRNHLGVSFLIISHNSILLILSRIPSYRNDPMQPYYQLRFHAMYRHYCRRMGGLKK